MQWKICKIIKSTGNDGLTKEFYEDFWDDIKELFIASVAEANYECELSTSQRQATTKVIEKEATNKKYIN